MNEAVVRRTQESLGRVIRRPPLTPPLLSRPPFRYLHDVIAEVIRVTGFLEGLYTEFELKSDNVKDKEAKVRFLQKAIDAVVMVTGEPLSVRPARVVAGHEPERTNEFLQAIGKCCLNKLSSDAAVKRILAGERPDAKEKPPSSKPRDKESKQPKPEEKGHKERRGDAEINDRSSSRDRKLKGVLKESEENQKESNKEKDNEERHKEPEREKQERERNKSRTSKQGRETEKNKGKGEVEGEDLERDKGQEKEKKNEGGREKEKLRGRDKDKAKDREREKDRERGRDQERGRQREKDGEHGREHGKDKAEKKAADSEESTLRKVQKPTKDSKGQPDNESESPAGISRQPSTKGSRQRARPGGEGAVEAKSVADRISEESVPKLQEKAEPAPATSQREGEAENVAPENPPVSENGEAPVDLPPQPIQRRVPRPSSARPAPPRVKPPGSAELVPPERSGSGKTVSNIIRDQEVSDDEDEQFVVEAAVPLLGMPDLEMEPEVELLEDQNHGGLVKRILETKKDYEASQTPAKAAEREKHVVLEAAKKKERDLVAKEMETFQASIQTLCRGALALGRTMDYVQEDMDAMRNELQAWRQENRHHAEALQREQSITDGAIEPLKAELAELEQLIKDQQDKICVVKANILRNEEKIRSMILGINPSSRGERKRALGLADIPTK